MYSKPTNALFDSLLITFYSCYIFLLVSMLHYLCNTTCYDYLHCTFYTFYTFVLLLPYFHYAFCTLFTFTLIPYQSPSCNWSKSIDSINPLYAFLYLVISSFLLSCKFIVLFMRRLIRSLCSLVLTHLKRMWSTAATCFDVCASSSGSFILSVLLSYIKVAYSLYYMSKSLYIQWL
jgi:hypothetical protein